MDEGLSKMTPTMAFLVPLRSEKIAAVGDTVVVVFTEALVLSERDLSSRRTMALVNHEP